LNFSTDESKVLIAPNPIFNPSAEITISAWVKTLNSNSKQNITVEAYGYCCHYDKSFYIANGYLDFYARAIGGGPGDSFSAVDSALSSNQWTFVAVTARTNERPMFYINGFPRNNPESTQTYSPAGKHSGGYITIGSEFDGVSNQLYEFNGNIDDVRIYNRALSAAEIKAIYNATK
jgi:hypothetical protein